MRRIQCICNFFFFEVSETERSTMPSFFFFRNSALGPASPKVPHRIIEPTENLSGSPPICEIPQKHHVSDPNLPLKISLLVYRLVHALVIAVIANSLIARKLGSTPRQRVKLHSFPVCRLAWPPDSGPALPQFNTYKI